MLRTSPVLGAGHSSRSAVGATDVSLVVVPHTTRSCGTCTACCDGWLTATIRGHEMKAGVPCHFRGTGCCTIYEERPDRPCRIFFCGWRLRNNPFPDTFRPDQLGVLIVAKQWRKRPGYELVSAGRDPDAALLQWMRDYSVATGTPFVYSIAGQRQAFGAPEFQQEFRDKTARGEPLW